MGAVPSKTSRSREHSRRRDERSLSPLSDVDQCARAIEKALEAMDPPIEVYAGIVRLIAEMASADEWLYQRRYFKVDDDGATITRTLGNYGRVDHRLSAYGAQTIASGRRSWRIRIEGLNHQWSSSYIGVSRNRDRANDAFNCGDSGYAFNVVRCLPASFRYFSRG